MGCQNSRGEEACACHDRSTRASAPLWARNGGSDVVAGGYDTVLRISPPVTKVLVNSGVPAGFKAGVGVFDGVVKAIKGMECDLPLSLVQTRPVSEMLRYTSVFGPVALTSSVAASLPQTARYMPSMDIWRSNLRGRWGEFEEARSLR